MQMILTNEGREKLLMKLEGLGFKTGIRNMKMLEKNIVPKDKKNYIESNIKSINYKYCFEK